jgi:hypothetical protein
MTIFNIVAGFKSTGIWPLNRSKVLEEVRNEYNLNPRPTTPLNEGPGTEKAVLFTPQKGLDIYKQFEWVTSANIPSREARSRKRSFLQFTAKRLNYDNATKASLRSEL